jgi:hypothetical protein
VSAYGGYGPYAYGDNAYYDYGVNPYATYDYGYPYYYGSPALAYGTR